ncbi:MAG: hypothetical protein PHE83_17420 [Opitutaceae bacterium]|nr:hypothetical protein [Opitutaceae bacterium]
MKRSPVTREILVIVHPSRPWEYRDEIQSRRRAAVLKRAELILEKLVNRLRLKRRPYTVMVGPYLNVGCGLSEHAIDQLRRLARLADVRLPGGRDRDSLYVAGIRIGCHGLRPRRVRVAGFYRDLCCEAVADGIRARCAHEVIIDRHLTRACPPGL